MPAALCSCYQAAPAHAAAPAQRHGCRALLMRFLAARLELVPITVRLQQAVV